MKVFGHALSSCTRKVLTTAAEKGQDVELVTVDLLAGEHKREGHLARHPFGVIPVLDDDGFVLFESRAIIRYLDARSGGPRLTPASPKGAARMDQWLSVDQSYVAPHVRALVGERVVKAHKGAAPDPAVADPAEKALALALSSIDGSLGEGSYLAGDSFSLADISLMPYVASLPMIGAEHVMTGLPRLGAWWSRVRERPSWKRVTATG